MAEVYRAQDEVLDRGVAVKVFRIDPGALDEAARRRIEVRMLAGLNHPGLVTVFDAGNDDSEPADPRSYLVMQLVDGPTLSHLMASGPLPRAEVCTIGAQLADALQYVHDNGIVHRDVKPANVLLTRDVRAAAWSAKLTDFGIARFLDSTRMTSFGATVGTASYLSPEQAAGQEITPASDIYSLGLVLLECLTGQRTFPGSGVEAAVARLHRDPTVPQWLGPELGRLLVSMTARDPQQRPDAQSVERALRHLRTATPLIADEDSSTDSLGPLPGIRWQAGVGAGVAAGAARRSPAASAPGTPGKPGRLKGRHRRAAAVAVGVAGAAVAVVVAFGSADPAANPSSASVPTTTPVAGRPTATAGSAHARTSSAAPAKRSMVAAPRRGHGATATPKATVTTVVTVVQPVATSTVTRAVAKPAAAKHGGKPGPARAKPGKHGHPAKGHGGPKPAGPAKHKKHK